MLKLEMQNHTPKVKTSKLQHEPAQFDTPKMRLIGGDRLRPNAGRRCRRQVVGAVGQGAGAGARTGQ